MFDKISCKLGCAGCCHQQVEISGDEAILYATMISNGFKIDNEKLQRQASLKHTASTWWRQPDEEKACIFLGSDKQCRIYANRPIVCRKYFVASPPEKCSEVSQTGEIKVGIHIITRVETIATAIQDFVRGEDVMPANIFKNLKPVMEKKWKQT